jgi:hypothetical protein
MRTFSGSFTIEDFTSKSTFKVVFSFSLQKTNRIEEKKHKRKSVNIFIVDANFGCDVVFEKSSQI